MTHDLLNRLQLIANKFKMYLILLRASVASHLATVEIRFIKATAAFHSIKTFFSSIMRQ